VGPVLRTGLSFSRQIALEPRPAREPAHQEESKTHGRLVLDPALRHTNKKRATSFLVATSRVMFRQQLSGCGAIYAPVPKLEGVFTLKSPLMLEH